jgi:S-adenosylmethionine:tRNA ribosyltransferase-isomerase
MMTKKTPIPRNVRLSDFSYELPDDRIARYPLDQREKSKLLVWKEGQIDDSSFEKLPGILPNNTLLVFNNSRVIEARIKFQKSTGGQIEIFCLRPYEDHFDIHRAMVQTGKALWSCLIGGSSKWKHNQILKKQNGETVLEARFIKKNPDNFIIEFSWSPAFLSFEIVLNRLGMIPLPPYLNRTAEISDVERYQTIYAKESGSVAAPTAGLHFSRNLLANLSEAGVESIYLTLHVGAGTFMPVKNENVSEHRMHEEFIELSAESVESLISKLKKTIIAVGTTSLRTLETLYWLGLVISKNENISSTELCLDQWFPYESVAELTAEESLTFLLSWISRQPGKKLITKTKLFILPGYQFKIIHGLITNFHQPHSTLLMLVSALIGSGWKTAYTFALKNDYRFLSYGDGCLFLPTRNLNTKL